MSMKPDLNDISELVAKAKIFAASVPEGDVRLHIIPQTDMVCAAIDHEISFAKLPLSELMRSESGARLALACEWLRNLLLLAKAFELSQEIGRGKVRNRERSRDLNSIKTENRQSRIKQVAKSYKHFANLHSDWLAGMIYEHIRDALKISERSLQGYLAEARKQGLIPKRHRGTR